METDWRAARPARLPSPVKKGGFQDYQSRGDRGDRGFDRQGGDRNYGDRNGGDRGAWRSERPGTAPRYLKQ